MDLDEKIRELDALLRAKDVRLQKQSDLEEKLAALSDENHQLKSLLEQSEASEPTKTEKPSTCTNSHDTLEPMFKLGDLSKLDNLSGDELTKELSSMLFPESSEVLERTNSSHSCPDDLANKERLSSELHTEPPHQPG